MSKTVDVYLKTFVLAILVASEMVPILTWAADYNVGVKAGDWIKYGQVTINWSGNGTEPSYVTEEKKADWLRIDVENVSGTIVTLNFTAHYNNGTQIPYNGTLDISGASGTGMSGFVLIASNLKEGDNLTSQANSPTINQTTAETWVGATRNVNLLKATSVYNNRTTTAEVRWDQNTGIMVEFYTKIPDYSNQDAYIETSFKATETNMWSAGLVDTLANYLIYIIAGTAIAVIVAATVAVGRRKPTAQQPLPAPQTEGQPPIT